ncbi:hypothetical protein Lser_V15G23040 [Lactuca serriola]
MQMGRIDPKRNFVMFTRNEGQKCLFALADKHLYTTACLEHVLGNIHRCKQNSADDKKYFDDMIQWYIHFRQTILALIPRLLIPLRKFLQLDPASRSNSLTPIDAKGEIVGSGRCCVLGELFSPFSLRIGPVHPSAEIEAEATERKMKEAHDLLESRKTLFPLWTLEKVLKEAIETPSILWLEPVISLDRINSVDSQFDMPLTRKAFTFHAFDNVADVPHPHPKVDRELVEFYLMSAQPQYQTWSAQKIINVRVLKPFREGNFMNVRFKVLRGSAKTEHAISLADLPNLNPHDWIILHNILLTNEAEYGPIIDHFKRMLVCYIMEV